MSNWKACEISLLALVPVGLELRGLQVAESVWNCDGGVIFAATTDKSSPSSFLSTIINNGQYRYR
jgi:hypothetical protein